MEVDMKTINPILEILERENILTKLIELMRNDKYEDKYINYQSIIAIGTAYKG